MYIRVPYSYICINYYVKRPTKIRHLIGLCHPVYTIDSLTTLWTSWTATPLVYAHCIDTTYNTHHFVGFVILTPRIHIHGIHTISYI